MPVTQQQLRRQAERLLALALQARERGEMELADQFTVRAMGYFEEASAATAATAAHKA
jgi:hypothetical protein